MRIPISFARWYRVLSWAVLIPPPLAHVTVTGDHVEVKMAWAFRARFGRSAISGVKLDESRPISRGAHGWRGRWLVNGKGWPLVAIDLDPPQRAYVLGVPIRLRRVTVSVDQPDVLIGAFR